MSISLERFAISFSHILCHIFNSYREGITWSKISCLNPFNNTKQDSSMLQYLARITKGINYRFSAINCDLFYSISNLRDNLAMEMLWFFYQSFWRIMVNIFLCICNNLLEGKLMSVRQYNKYSNSKVIQNRNNSVSTFLL